MSGLTDAEESHNPGRGPNMTHLKNHPVPFNQLRSFLPNSQYIFTFIFKVIYIYILGEDLAVYFYRN